MRHELWYTRPAAHWEEALPLGNGRLGVMPMEERFALNEDSFWSGYPSDRNRQGAAEFFPLARDLALEGRFGACQDLVEREMLGGFTESYLPLGNLWIRHPQKGTVTEYRRALDLRQAVYREDKVMGGVRWGLTLFVSHVHQAVFLRMEAQGGPLEADISLDSPVRGRFTAGGQRITGELQAPSHVVPSYLESEEAVVYSEAPEEKGMRACLELTARGDGDIRPEGSGLRVRGGTWMELRLCARTSFAGFRRHPFLEGKDERRACREDLERAEAVSFTEAMDAHIREHRSWYDRVDLELGEDDLEARDTETRVRENDPEDVSLEALLFHFGRYLLISSSRPGTECANLQGIWNQDLRAVWSCNDTLNINTEMNYWPAESTGLGEMAEPLWRMIRELAERGRETARVHYGARGTVAHHNTDLWRLANPVGETYHGFAGCAFWPLSLGWLLRHVREHDRYHRSDAFLLSFLPVYRDVVRFFLDIAVRDRDGYLTLAPAVSPENQFRMEGRNCRVSARVQMTTGILREVFMDYLEIQERLGGDEMTEEVREALGHLASCALGSRGQILEWEREYPESEREHRHISHLYELYPARMADERFREGARRSLMLRGDEGTGWSLAWKTAAWAVLGDGEHAGKLLRRQLKCVEAGSGVNLQHGGSYISLLDAHPPFQIDGNLGMTQAMVEMLVQTEGDTILLMPAVPERWKEGSVRGFCLPGERVLDFSFRSGRVRSLRLRGKGPVTVDLGDRRLQWDGQGELVWKDEE